MRVYWRKVKRGENLILSDENDGHEEELGGFRDTQGVTVDPEVRPALDSATTV